VFDDRFIFDSLLVAPGRGWLGALSFAPWGRLVIAMHRAPAQCRRSHQL